HDGKDLYLLQCRPQSYSGEASPDSIPKDIPTDCIVFTANKFVSNGKVPDITHIVYFDPTKYTEIEDRETMLMVGRAVGKLNKALPKRKFILMGPGRWGSRGDIKLGVNVTYSDINNTSMLIEIARKKGNYVPDLSFGTHFFQDLVEANIRYLPLYPDTEEIIFNEKFLLESENVLTDILPEFSELSSVIHVIDVAKSTNGSIMKVLINADIESAVGMFAQPSTEVVEEKEMKEQSYEYNPGDHWRWRMKMAERIASEIDPERFGVKGVYVFGSTKNATASPESDIDLIVHIDKAKCNVEQLRLWFEGWSLALSEVNYLRTGRKTKSLLDVQFVSDLDITGKAGFGQKINAATDAAKSLKLKS
ncbi:MAG: nucleotidyltransferase domain-containing protein, partial [Ignavibacteria bacterium]|nr:nucleotidyltransferase domain-containing protein [Ignavibacteria bacterium]